MITVNEPHEEHQLKIEKPYPDIADPWTSIKDLKEDLAQQIQKRTAVEDRLAEIQRLYDTMIYNFPEGAIGILRCNEQREIEWPDLTNAGLKITDIQELLCAGETRERLHEALNGGSISFEINSKDKIYSIWAVPLPDSKNFINEILYVVQDVTLRRRMDEELRKALKREKELGILKSRFVTLASHEFRTPLTTILSSTFLLENYAGENYDNQKSIHTKRIKRAVNSLTMILNEFLSLEKLEANKVNLVHSNINLPEYINDLILEMTVAKKDGQTIEYEHIGNQSITRLDHQLLWSILTNLISNSLKYSKPEENIVMVSEINDESILFKITDHGIGIPDDEQKCIFERFYRARNALNIEGTGLGLHIVQKYVHLLNGTIAFESKLNEGTTFNVILPVIRN